MFLLGHALYILSNRSIALDQVREINKPALQLFDSLEYWDMWNLKICRLLVGLGQGLKLKFKLILFYKCLYHVGSKFLRSICISSSWKFINKMHGAS